MCQAPWCQPSPGSSPHGYLGCPLSINSASHMPCLPHSLPSPGPGGVSLPSLAKGGDSHHLADFSTSAPERHPVLTASTSAISTAVTIFLPPCHPPPTQHHVHTSPTTTTSVFISVMSHIMVPEKVIMQQWHVSSQLCVPGATSSMTVPGPPSPVLALRVGLSYMIPLSGPVPRPGGPHPETDQTPAWYRPCTPA